MNPAFIGYRLICCRVFPSYRWQISRQLR